MSKYNLAELFKEYNIHDICLDSRKVKKGDVFFAVDGCNNNGQKYIDDARRVGANLVITKGDAQQLQGSIYYTKDITQTFIEAANIIYPNIPQHIIAVTGTSGKSSVASYCQQLLQILGYNSASIGTLGVKCNDKDLQQEFNNEEFNSLTTPDIITLSKTLNKLANNDVEYAVLEASSHGIKQNRLGNIKAEVAAFISFGHDHLDYHKTWDDYLHSKLKLFSDHLISDGTAIVNKDSKNSVDILKFLTEQDIKIITVGEQADLKIIGTEQTLQGQRIEFSYQNKNYKIFSPIIGSYQATNLLIAALLVAKVIAKENIANLEKIFTILPKLTAVEGRLQKIESTIYNIFVDYAHKPDALENCLQELNKLKLPGKKLVLVFGCGGDRDTEKRPIMGKIANTIADIVIVTDDNPRFEQADLIRAAILTEAKDALEISDRYQAIKKAIEFLNEGDILLIAGKGHEKYQIIGDEKRKFDDVKVVEQILEIM